MLTEQDKSKVIFFFPTVTLLGSIGTGCFNVICMLRKPIVAFMEKAAHMIEDE